MRIKSLQLRGFKSFAGSTEISFEPGVNSIVGPNGSGKSNIIDALAWVMGEQGTRSLRGGKMEDVVFSGTASKSPLGQAHVEVTLQALPDSGGLGRTEVSLSRTVFRSGGSEYFLNGQSCRLLDIQDALSDLGLGREMHTIVGQGHLDSVLRATPAERRALVEEAAGVLKFRRRKERTERKLEAMAGNLVRLSDLVAELNRGRKSLARQAGIASQARELQSQSLSLRQALFSRSVHEKRELLEFQGTVEANLRLEINALQERLEQIRNLSSAIEASRTQESVLVSKSQLLSLESLERRHGWLLEPTATSRGSDPRDLSIKKEEAKRLQDNLRSIESQREALAVTQVELTERIEGLERKRKAAASRVDEEYSVRSELVREADREMAIRTQLAQQIERIRADLGNLEVRKSSSEEEIKLLTGRKKSAAEELTALEANLPDSEFQSRKTLDAAQNSELQFSQMVEKIQSEWLDLQSELSTKRAKLEALNTLLAGQDGEDITNAAKASEVSLVAKHIKIRPGFEIAISAALAELGDAYLIDSPESAFKELESLRSTNGHRASFVVQSEFNEKKAEVPPEKVTLATEVVTAPQALMSRLRALWIVATLQDAREIFGAASDQEKTLVTLDGEIASSSFFAGGSASTNSKVELVVGIEKLHGEITQLVASVDLKAKELEESQSQLEKVRQQIRQLTEEFRNRDAELAKKAEAIGASRARVESLNHQIELVSESISALDSESLQLIAMLTQLEDDQSGMPDATVVPDDQKLTSLVSELEAAREEEVQTRIELGSIRERLLNLDRDLVEKSDLMADIQLEIQNLERDAQAIAEKDSAVARATAILPVLGLAIKNSISNLKKRTAELEDQKKTELAQLDALNRERLELEQRSSSLAGELQNAEMRSYELKVQLSAIEERIREELQISLGDLEGTEPADLADRSDAELESELRKIDNQLRVLGSFNPLAEEEYAALEERLNYLSTQLDDLNEAKSELRGIIREIDEKIQTTFAAAFEDTKREFEKVFPILFPGGSGSLSLTKPEEGEEVGIDVSVRPAGKRIERMSLLSGGERSLAAMALLVAIFKARPSPFYVLDEVEAALDDTNLDRLLQVLKTLGEASQLIIVTHQKRTMEIADALYGVSMGKDGVTKVMSQTLEKAS